MLGGLHKKNAVQLGSFNYPMNCNSRKESHGIPSYNGKLGSSWQDRLLHTKF
jgi:hypothetical protein